MKNNLFHFVRNLSSLSILLILFIFSNTYGQMQKFPMQNPNLTSQSSFLLSAPNNDLLYFWYEGTILNQSRSTDNGAGWSSGSQLVDSLTDADSVRDVNSFATATGRILLIYKKLYYYLKYSDDNGTSWSSANKLSTGFNITARFSYAGNFSQSSSGKIFLVYSKYGSTVQNVYYIASTDNGITWSSQVTVLTGPAYGSIVASSIGGLTMFYQDKGIYTETSINDGVTWQYPYSVISDSGISAPRAIMDRLGKIWLFYVNHIATPFNNITQTDIFYKTSTDNGYSWSAQSNFTKFKGMDNFFSISNKGNNPLITFISNRYNGNTDQYNIWYGTAGVTDDINTPSYLYQYNASNLNPPAQKSVKLTIHVDDNYTISSVELNRTLNGNIISPISMHDDGLQGDSIANDKIYTCIVPGLNMENILQTSFTLINNVGQNVTYNGPAILVPFDYNANTQLINVNNFNLPINNSGVIADVINNGVVGGGKLNNNIFLYSSGFFMSGLANGSIWANGVATSSRINDYLPGRVGSLPDDPKNILYIVKSSDPDFGPSWQNWKNAVGLGADFYDGDHDGVYNPVDKNGNGKWDLDEDRPSNSGDFTTWCVYNDGLPSSFRTIPDVAPQGIEIQQSVFAKNDQGDLGNVMFVEYKIINRGTAADVLNSVYFGAFADPDIGDNGASDLDGFDSLINSGYTYHPTNESVKWGATPPAFFITSLQGPLSYIPGVTFLDNNSNGIYDAGTDTPLDTAYNLKGLAGIRSYPGAKNLRLSSFHQYYNGVDPTDRYQLRDYTIGLDNTGSQINPCTWYRGTVMGGINCANVNPMFMYSGDPVTSTGWIDTVSEDQRLISNFGPFELRKNQPVDIVLAYVIGRGSDGLNSISVARGITKSAINYYKTNYNWGTTSVSDKNNAVIKTFSLAQNFPNPFNPNTRIKYTLPVDSHIKLVIYNAIGQIVKVLADENQTDGAHEVNFNPGSLSSGVYFYTLQSNSIDGKQNYTNTKKMILLK